MSHPTFHKRLEKIISKIDEYFNSPYKLPIPQLSSSSSNHEIPNPSKDVNVYHNNSDRMIILPVTNNYIYKEKEEKKEDDTIQSSLGGTIIIGVASLTGTYIIATDEYTNY